MRLPHALLVAMTITACAPRPGEAENELASAAQPVQIPCVDPQACPDLIPPQFWLSAGMLLDTRSFKPSSCAVHEEVIKPGKRRLLRMNVGVANVGAGELILGAPSDHPDLFHFDECHNHLHFLDFDNLRLWLPDDYAEWVALREAYPSALPNDLLDAHPDLRRRIVEGRKIHFCLGEYFHCEPALGCPAGQTIGPSNHPSVDPNTCAANQGLSVGWMDVY